MHNNVEEEITGDVLLEMTPDLLKELGISTFGKRFRLHSAIKMLKDRMPSIEESVSIWEYISTLVIQLMLISNRYWKRSTTTHEEEKEETRTWPNIL